MPAPSLPATSDDRGAASLLAWRVLRSAAAWARHAPAGGAGGRSAFGADAGGGLVPAGPEQGRAWLVWQSAGGWTAGAGAPDEARALLDLYLPVCGAGAPRPLTLAHLGQSLDGFVATGSGDSYYVTGPENLTHLHRLRALSDAVIVGAGTVERDDPQLTVRHVEGANPVRVVLDPRRRLKLEHRVFAAGTGPTLLVCAAEHADRGGARHGGAEVLGVPTVDGRFRLDALLARLHERGLYALFVEGGGATVSSFLEAGLLDRLHVAIAPLVTGSGRPGLTLPARDTIAECLRPRHRVFAMGGDVLFDCDLRAPAGPPDEATGEVARVF